MLSRKSSGDQGMIFPLFLLLIKKSQVTARLWNVRLQLCCLLPQWARFLPKQSPRGAAKTRDCFPRQFVANNPSFDQQNCSHERKTGQILSRALENPSRVRCDKICDRKSGRKRLKMYMRHIFNNFRVPLLRSVTIETCFCITGPKRESKKENAKSFNVRSPISKFPVI